MNEFQKASKTKLRFLTDRGTLSTEQLWDLPMTALANAIKAVKKVLNKTEDSDVDFLDTTKVVDEENQLRFDILKAIYIAKRDERDAAKAAADNKEHNQKILALIQAKKDDDLKSLSVTELEKLLV